MKTLVNVVLFTNELSIFILPLIIAAILKSKNRGENFGILGWINAVSIVIASPINITITMELLYWSLFLDNIIGYNDENTKTRINNNFRIS